MILQKKWHMSCKNQLILDLQKMVGKTFQIQLSQMVVNDGD